MLLHGAGPWKTPPRAPSIVPGSGGASNTVWIASAIAMSSPTGTRAAIRCLCSKHLQTSGPLGRSVLTTGAARSHGLYREHQEALHRRTKGRRPRRAPYSDKGFSSKSRQCEILANAERIRQLLQLSSLFPSPRIINRTGRRARILAKARITSGKIFLGG